MKDLLILPERYYDVKVKSQEKALSIVKIHKRPQDHCAAPKEMLRAWYLGAGYRCQRGLSESVSKVFVYIDDTDLLLPPFDPDIILYGQYYTADVVYIYKKAESDIVLKVSVKKVKIKNCLSAGCI